MPMRRFDVRNAAPLRFTLTYPYALYAVQVILLRTVPRPPGPGPAESLLYL